MINEIDTFKLDRIRQQQNIRLVDVRSQGEREQHNIPESEHIPLHLIPLKMNEYQKNETIVFYCATGARSSQACFYFQSKGHGNVFNLKGGIRAWAQNGYPLVSANQFVY
ncbi:MAG: rhodanese-like domain-containing protein [Methylococcales bacterium]|nr:rhodanese-like domain-containing protein [Methylococcales bacterium]MBT7444137.1 rhodanese-like domain-containing protein [Methylococcales bacterium]